MAPVLGKFSRFFSFKTVFWTLFYIFIFSLLLNNSLGYLDPDLGWHLKVGEDIVREAKVPHLNYYNYTLEGKTWVDHEWLLNVITFWLYNNFSNIGLNIFFALIIIAALLILHRSLKKDNSDRPANVLLTVVFLILGVLAMSPHLGVRMQEIALLCLVLFYAVLSNFNKKRNYRVLLWLIPLFYFWASAHASFLIGLFILGFWLGIKLLEIILLTYWPGSRFTALFQIEPLLTKKQIAIFLAFIGLGLAATLVTPYGINLYEFLWTYTDTYFMTHIAEWLPSWYLPLAYWQLIFLSLALASVILFFLDKNVRKKKISLWELSLLLFFLVLSFKSKRHFPLFFISAFPLVIKNFGKIFDLNSKEDFFKCSSRLICAFMILSLIAVPVSILMKINFASDPFNHYCGDYPCGAAAYFKNHPEYDRLNIFNEYAWGGYLIWTLPQKKIFIDGRLPIFPVEGHTFLEEYMEFFKKDNLPGILDKYNIRLVLIRSKEKGYNFNYWEKKFFSINKEDEGEKNELSEFLKNSKNWGQIYEDNVAAIFIRK
jgi:hypothetical protein